jgi:hypothetical protein
MNSSPNFDAPGLPQRSQAAWGCSMAGVGGWIGSSLMRHLLLLCLAFAGFASAQNFKPLI